MPSHSPPNAATRVFHFKRCLGSGSFGEVYEATMTSTGGLEKRVAVKLLKPEVADDEDAIRRLRDEGMLLSSLDHPSILAVIDLVELGERRALVTEFVDGQDLLELLRGTERIPLRPFVLAIAQVARALDVAWSTRLPGRDTPLRLLHRDIKPANIRVGRHGLVKLLDFGIARSDELEREARTETDMLVGSVPYMAPEVFSQGATDRLDVFALGCVLFEGAFGAKLYANQKRPQVLGLLVSEERFKEFVANRLEGGRNANPDLHPIVVRSVADCLAWSPEDRPSAADLASRLERVASTIDGPSLAEWCRQRHWPEPRKRDGQLVGSTLTEGSMRVAAEGLDPEAPSGRRATLAMVAVGALVVGCLGLVGVGGVLSGVLAPAVVPPADVEPVAPPEPVPPASPEPAEEPSPPEPEAPAPSPAPPPVPEPVPSPERPAAQPVPEPAPSPAPPPAAEPAPQPAPSPSPAETPAPKGPVSVWFQNQAGDRFGPEQELPPGPYRIIADFGDGAERVGSAEVAPGQEIRLVCNPAARTCSLKE